MPTFSDEEEDNGGSGGGGGGTITLTWNIYVKDIENSTFLASANLNIRYGNMNAQETKSTNLNGLAACVKEFYSGHPDQALYVYQVSLNGYNTLDIGVNGERLPIVYPNTSFEKVYYLERQ